MWWDVHKVSWNVISLGRTKCSKWAFELWLEDDSICRALQGEVGTGFWCERMKAFETDAQRTTTEQRRIAIKSVEIFRQPSYGNNVEVLAKMIKNKLNFASIKSCRMRQLSSAQLSDPTREVFSISTTIFWSACQENAALKELRQSTSFPH